MNKTIVASIIGGIATIIAAFIGLYAGKSAEQKSIQNEINEIVGDMVNIIGTGNEVTINDIGEFVTKYLKLESDYQNLEEKYESATNQNIDNYNALTEANKKIKQYESQSDAKVQELEQIIAEMPTTQFKSIGLSIEGNIIPINSNDSSVIINNRTYYSDEFIKNLIDSNTNMSIRDNTMYIGKIIKEKAYLSDQWVFDFSSVRLWDNLTDSYGKIHTNSLQFESRSDCHIVYNLNREFSFIRFNLFICDTATNNNIGTLTVKADDEIVYTSPELSKITEKVEAMDIPIKNCSLLTIEYSSTGSNNCIMSDAEIYN